MRYADDIPSLLLYALVHYAELCFVRVLRQLNGPWHYNEKEEQSAICNPGHISVQSSVTSSVVQPTD